MCKNGVNKIMYCDSIAMYSESVHRISELFWRVQKMTMMIHMIHYPPLVLRIIDSYIINAWCYMHTISFRTQAVVLQSLTYFHPQPPPPPPPPITFHPFIAGVTTISPTSNTSGNVSPPPPARPLLASPPFPPPLTPPETSAPLPQHVHWWPHHHFPHL